ncbi:UNVERIFIED_CONTAM: hypothetical protein Sradi_3142600 [Sesamum radiatum]|uniref:Uncharacterized protein n=1 Tax=Sesamum radiatum TaxID=300843 RepID=A0AAW2RFN7_SESRA
MAQGVLAQPACDEAFGLRRNMLEASPADPTTCMEKKAQIIHKVSPNTRSTKEGRVEIHYQPFTRRPPGLPRGITHPTWKTRGQGDPLNTPDPPAQKVNSVKEFSRTRSPYQSGNPPPKQHLLEIRSEGAFS